MKKNLSWSITGIIFIIFFIFIWKGCSYMEKKYSRLPAEGKRTLGTVRSVSSRIVVEYEVNNIKYTTSTPKPYPNIEPREHFEVAYDSLEPKTAMTLFSNPVIISENAFGRTESIEVENVKFVSMVRFSYEVDGEIRYNYAALPPDLENKKADIYGNNKKYLVKYNIERPYIAYLYVDSLISE
jgi:hypothetical protein